MQMHELRGRIAKEQRAQQLSVMNAIMVSLFAVMTAALGPQLAYEYILTNTEVETQVLILQYIPAFSYLASALFVVYALGMNFLRTRRIAFYEQELELLAYVGDDATSADSSLDDLQAALMEVEAKSAPAKKSTAKKASKKSVAKRTKKSTK